MDVIGGLGTPQSPYRLIWNLLEAGTPIVITTNRKVNLSLLGTPYDEELK